MTLAYRWFAVELFASCQSTADTVEYRHNST